MAQLHILAQRFCFVERYGDWAWAVKLLLTLTWPIRLAIETKPLLRHFGKRVLDSHGISLARQVTDIAELGIGFGLSPLAYYRYWLFLPANRARLCEYVFDHEIGSLFPYLNGFRVDLAVDDKRLFGDRCRAAGVASVPLMAWAQSQRLHRLLEIWPNGDLISKPAVGSQGRGVVLWRAVDGGLYKRDSQTTMSGEQLLLWLAEAHQGNTWLLQPALQNHDSVGDLSIGPLVTVRMMTALDATGNCEDFAAVLKMPYGKQIVSNSGIGSSIDLESGTLGRAFPYLPLHPGFDQHPDTGATITGRVLSDWNGIRQLARSAHALFPTMRLLGWDIALTPGGPVLLETNLCWEVAMPQIAMQGPLGETRFPELCERLLAKP